MHSCFGFVDLESFESWLFSPGFGILGLEPWGWIPGFGVLGSDSCFGFWVGIPGFSVQALDSCVWSPGFGLLGFGLLGLKPWVWTPPWFGNIQYAKTEE